jgi:hypothetical protein
MFSSIEEAEKQPYLPVIAGEVRPDERVVFGPEWLKQLFKLKFSRY